MKCEIITTDYFKKVAKPFFKKYKGFDADLEEMINYLEKNPTAGTNLGNNLYKVRMASKAKGSGKSGGFRIITYHVEKKVDSLYVNLITIYDKSEEDTIKTSELKALVKSIIP